MAFLRWAGYDAQGLELSPWLTGFARQTFNIPILQGPLEDQNLKTSSYDVVAYMDVLEHFPNPLDTMKITAEISKNRWNYAVSNAVLRAGKIIHTLTTNKRRVSFTIEGHTTSLLVLKAVRSEIFLNFWF